MGQNSSRYHQSSTRPTSSAHSSPTNPLTGASTDPQPVLTTTGDSHTSDASGSRRSSVRKSILKFVKPDNIRSRPNSVASNRGDVRRSWLNPRRWSKNPLDATTPPSEPQLDFPSTDLTEGTPNLPPSPDEGKQREIDLPLGEDDNLHDASVSSLDPTSQLPIAIDMPDPNTNSETPVLDTPHLSTEALADFQAANTDSSRDPLEDVQSDIPPHEPSPIYEPNSNDTTSTTESQPPGTPTRQFPPPGTLVVVQGIVHTTDVSRTGSTPPPSSVSSSIPRGSIPSSNSRPTSPLNPAPDQGTGRARNRLSTFLRPRSRPTSALVTDSTPATGVATSSEADTVETPTYPPTEDSAQTAAANQALGESLDSHNDESLAATNTSPSTIESRVPSISSSSIDVLGTLLSVAAAATAASLLTGSSEPILSSGLAPPNSSSSPLSTANTRPSSPASATSLPDLPPYPRSPSPAPYPILPDTSAAGRAERVRQAWGTIRERLGLRPSVPPGHEARDLFQQDNHDEASSPADSGPPADTRELMLAEMARAFNIGLGLNGLGGSNGHGDREPVAALNDSSQESNTPASGPDNDASLPVAPPVVAMPPEGSFERFLVDLQIDLRTALTQAEDDVHATQGRPQNAAPQAPARRPILTTTDIASLPTVAPPAQASPSIREDYSASPADQTPQALHVNDDFYADMPFLQDVSDSESEFDDENEDDFHSAALRPVSVQGQAELLDGTPPSGTGRIDASGRINWWRLYRFPPIMSPRMDTTGLRHPFLSASQPISSLSATPATTPHVNRTSMPTEDSSASTGETTSSPLSQPIPTPAGDTPISPLHTVVPVIVVGLQSVNQEWRPDLATPGESEGVDFFGQPVSEEMNGSVNENGDDQDLDDSDGHSMSPFTAGDDAPGRGRTRGWHSRAANAIRNLRPGRRNTEAGPGAQPPLVAPGSRTFLIYVIGGYYPPDHSIVTGGPNILDSFEALLELADLLGQVKPPTVSKDDIEKSGLQIIKASELVQHEKEGKVSSNCLDRCLICLDDYEPEDPIRVMSCRHAFHKGCVDEWLQKGRNNCPACRSTGVTTDTNATPMPAS